MRGPSLKQKSYQECLLWWRAAFESGFSVPLAPRKEFPEPGEEGCAFLFSDAAREAGTGYGGFSFVAEAAGEKGPKVPMMLFMAELWEEHIRRHLQANRLSMPAGEAIGVIVLIDSLARYLEGLSHLVVYTDSDAAAAALNTGNSPSPQMDFLVRWLADRRAGLQLLAVHIPGRSNRASDSLSRNSWQEMVAEAEASGARLRRLRPADECKRLIEHAVTLSQRGAPHRNPPPIPPYSLL